MSLDSIDKSEFPHRKERQNDKTDHKVNSIQNWNTEINIRTTFVNKGKEDRETSISHRNHILSLSVGWDSLLIWNSGTPYVFSYSRRATLSTKCFMSTLSALKLAEKNVLFLYCQVTARSGKSLKWTAKFHLSSPSITRQKSDMFHDKQETSYSCSQIIFIAIWDRSDTHSIIRLFFLRFCTKLVTGSGLRTTSPQSIEAWSDVMIEVVVISVRWCEFRWEMKDVMWCDVVQATAYYDYENAIDSDEDLGLDEGSEGDTTSSCGGSESDS